MAGIRNPLHVHRLERSKINSRDKPKGNTLSTSIAVGSDEYGLELEAGGDNAVGWQLNKWHYIVMPFVQIVVSESCW